jgi:hypothetical protein
MILDNIQFIQFLPDIINLLFLITVIVVFCIRYKINKKYLFVFFISLLSPFLFYFIWHWSFLPDQSKYLYRVYSLRNFSYNETIYSLLFSRIDFSSLLLSLFPIPFVTTIVSISLINRGILLMIVMYFLIKKKYYFLVSLLLFLPSMIVISSVALRDMLVIAIGILFFYFFLEKKNYFKSLFFGILFILTKPHLAIACIVISIVYFIFFIKFKLKKININSCTILLLTSIFFFICLFLLRDLFNSYKNGFFSEEFAYYLISEDKNITISSILKSFFSFLFSPLSTEIINLKNIIIFTENIFIIFLTILLLKKIYRENQMEAIYWTISWFLLFITFGFTIINAGTIWRYKLAIQMIFLSALYFSFKNKKNTDSL